MSGSADIRPSGCWRRLRGIVVSTPPMTRKDWRFQDALSALPSVFNMGDQFAEMYWVQVDAPRAVVRRHAVEMMDQITPAVASCTPTPRIRSPRD